MISWKRVISTTSAALLICLFFAVPVGGAQPSDSGFAIEMKGLDQVEETKTFTTGIKILALLTILSLAPSILIMVTSFTRIIIVFHFLRQAIGVQGMPPNQVLIGLALFLTFFIMPPVGLQIHDEAYVPYRDGEIGIEEALQKAVPPLREFMFRNTRESDLSLFLKTANLSKPNTREDVPTHVLIPAFIMSELKTAFQIGFLLFLPFLIIDILTASVLLSMGMMMLPPILISLPFKILLFIMVDGWGLVVGSLIRSFS